MVEMTGFADRLDVGYHMKKEKMALMFWSGVNAVGIYQDGGNLPGKSHGWRSLVGCSPWGHKESDTTERLHFHLSLSYIGEGNGNPLQCSCLENPRDRGAWWAAVYRVAQSQTRLKRFSNSSNSKIMEKRIRWSHFLDYN